MRSWRWRHLSLASFSAGTPQAYVSRRGLLYWHVSASLRDQRELNVGSEQEKAAWWEN